MRSERVFIAFASGLAFFCKNHPGILLVVVGVAGEVICEWGKEKGVRGRLIRLFGMLLVIGLLLEIWEAVKSDEQVAKLVQSNLVLASQLEETRINQTKIDPQNLPITSVRANAVIFVRGTNVWRNIDPVKDNHFVSLSIGNRDWIDKNNTSKLHLVCKNFERFGGGDDMEWILEFGPDLMPSPFGPSWNLTPSDSVRSANEWDFLLLDASFLRNKSEITRGQLSLVINTTVKHFQIPPQLAEQQFGRFADMKLIGSTASNNFNVIVLPGP